MLKTGVALAMLVMVGAALGSTRDPKSEEPTVPGFCAPRDVPAALSPSALRAPSCPPEMVRVEGEYCTEVRHRCTEWLDDPKLPYARCAEYAPEARCIGERRPMRFCIDRYEYTARGETLPKNHLSFATGSALCHALGKRLCTEAEWNFACEGEEMRPYPYGWRREPKCNQDRSDLYEMKVVDGRRVQVLRDDREPADGRPGCVSPFGVHNLVGNLDEPVLREEARYQAPFRNGLKGGWWMAARNRCRPVTTAHDDYYEDTQVGVRCCSDLTAESAKLSVRSKAAPAAPGEAAGPPDTRSSRVSG